MLHIFIGTPLAPAQGFWIDAWNTDPDEILKKAKELGEEPIITDYEWEVKTENGPLVDVFDAEREGLISTLETIKKIKEERYDNKEDLCKLHFLVRYKGYDLEDAILRIDEVVFYEDKTLQEVAETLLDEGHFGEVPDSVYWCIDTKCLASQLEGEGFYELDCGVFEHY